MAEIQKHLTPKQKAQIVEGARIALSAPKLDELVNEIDHIRQTGKGRLPVFGKRKLASHE